MTQSRRRSYKELKYPLFYSNVLCEFLTTAILLAYVTYAGFVHFDGFDVNFVQFGLSIGFIVFILIETFVQFGGGQMNPAVTLAFLLRGETSFVEAVAYVVAQCAGGAAGSGAVYVVVDPKHRDMFHAIKPAEELGPWRAVAVEAVVTAMLCFIILAVSEPRRKTAYPMPGLPIGATVATGIMTTGISAGGAMNPMVPFGPAVVSGDFEHHWVYWVGPGLGSVASSVIYLLLSYAQRHCKNYKGHSEEESGDRFRAVEDEELKSFRNKNNNS